MLRPLSKHTLSLLTCLILLAPAQLPAPAAGSAILHSPADFKNGTVHDTTVETEGLRLKRTTVPDDWMFQGCVFSPPTVCSPAFGYDPVRGASYLVGRSRTTTSEPTDEAWKYDAGKDLWDRLNMVAMPAAADGAGFYDDSAGRMIMLSSDASKTHMLTVDNGNWAPLNPAAPPSARTGYSLAFDNSSRKAYLFGGVAGGTYPNDTWVYEANTNTWTNPSTSGAPPGRANATMAYDPSNDAVILFGGSVTVGGLKTLQGDTWVYYPGNSTWKERTPAASPPARESSAMVHCPPSNETVLFGGVISGSKEFVNDTWTYRLAGNAWTNRTNDSAPAPRSRHSMAYDAGNGLVVMAGGLGHADYNWRADSWSLDRKTWNWTMGTLHAPSWRTGAEYAQDSRNGTYYIFGGNDGAFVPDAPNSHIFCGDTWKFDGRAGKWRLLAPTKACQKLSPRSGLRTSWGMEASGSTMVYDERNNDLMLFGPMAGDWDAPGNKTYIFDLSPNSTGEWKDAGAAGIDATMGGVYSAAYDPRTGEMLLFECRQGNMQNLYSYNGSPNASWKPYNKAIGIQNAFEDASMVFLESTGELFLYGSAGHSPVTATFNFTKDTWSKTANANDPPARMQFSLAYDSFRNEVALAGGYVDNPPGVVADTWCFNVTAGAWTELDPKNPYPKMTCPTSFYCGPQNEVHMLGGIDAPTTFPFLYSFDRRNYCQTGEYISSINDTGGESHFGRISWNADLPDNTSILAQVRSGADTAALKASNYTGKNASANAYYRNGDQINPIHNGNRYIQYKLFMNSTSIWSTPLLRSINITINRRHAVNITSPSNGSTWTGQKTISWQIIGDPDRDNYTSTVELYDAIGTTLLKNITTTNSTTRSYSWDTRYVADGTYRIRVNVTDGNTEIPLNNSSMTETFTISHPNHAPMVELTNPQYAAIINTKSTTIEWNGFDIDNDSLNYTIYVETDEFTEEFLPDPYAYTNATDFTILDLVNNTMYFWSVIASDGKETGMMPPASMFRVELQNEIQENHPPTVTLLMPPNGEDVTTFSTRLSWSGSDTDRDPLTYWVFLAEASFNLSTLPSLFKKTGETTVDLTNLTNGTTYYWAVIANDSKVNGSGLTVWSFKVHIFIPPDTPQVIEHAPNGTKVPLSPVIMVGFDLAMNYLSVGAAFSIAPGADIINCTPSGNGYYFYLGSPLMADTTYMVTISTTARSNAGKNMILPFNWTFTTKAIDDIDADPPYVPFTDPLDGAQNVDKWKNITVYFSEAMALTPTMAACSITPHVNGSWQWKDGRGFALRFVPTAGFNNGTYKVTISRAATDESRNPLAGINTFNFTIGNQITGNASLLSKSPIGAGILTGVSLVMVFNRSMDPSSISDAFRILPFVEGCWTFDPDRRVFTYTPSKKLRLGTTYSITLARNATDIHGNRLDKDYQWYFKTVPRFDDDGFPPLTWLIPAIMATIVAVGVAVALSRRGRAAARRAAAAAPRGFAVDDIFLMYNDGRLIHHTTRRLKADMDVDIFTSMLTALQGFVKESVGRESGGELGSMEYGGNKVLLEKGKHVVVAVVITGGEPAGFRDDMRTAVRNIEGELGAVLAGWDGSTARLAGAQKFLELLGSYRAAEEPAAAAAARIDVSVRSELEFYQGFVRLKVAVKNQMETMIARAELKLVFNEGVLRLDRIEPAVESRGGEVVLGIIEPGEKKTVAFYLDPQICTESYIEGVLTFKDARGNLETVKMPRKLASVVCPVLFTDENINTAMLKRMAAEELDKKDSKVFTIPSTMTPEKAFEVGKAAVQHHDLRLVRELKEEKPFRAEAWYYGKAKGRADRLVVRVRVIPEMTFMEFSVSSDSVLMLTGMLAELKSDLNKELEAHHLKGAMKQVTDRDDMEAVAEIRLLLEKAKEPDGG